MCLPDISNIGFCMASSYMISKYLPFLYFMIFLLYLAKQSCQESSNWTHKVMRNLPKHGRILDILIWNFKRVLNFKHAFKVVCVNNPVFLLFLIEGTYQSKNLPSNQFIIINYYKHFKRLTKLESKL